MDAHTACYMGANGREGKKGQAERGKGVESSVLCVAREDEAVGCMAGRVRVVWVAGAAREVFFTSTPPLLLKVPCTGCSTYSSVRTYDLSRSFTTKKSKN